MHRPSVFPPSGDYHPNSAGSGCIPPPPGRMTRPSPRRRAVTGEETYWQWLNGNITKEGITKDLEAMHEQGITRVIHHITSMGGAKGPVSPLMSDIWFDHWRYNGVRGRPDWNEGMHPYRPRLERDGRPVDPTGKFNETGRLVAPVRDRRPLGGNRPAAAAPTQGLVQGHRRVGVARQSPVLQHGGLHRPIEWPAGR